MPWLILNEGQNELDDDYRYRDMRELEDF